MKYAKIEKNSVANGPGIRVVLWCQGCSIHCPGCHNESTWDFSKGNDVMLDDITDMFLELNKPYVQGLTLSGGNPLETYNIDTCTEIAKQYKDRFPHKDLWLYTGLLWEDIQHLDIFKYVDVVVDGPYVEKLRDINLPYCGSKNQRVIDVKKSFETKGVVLYEIH